MGLVLVKITSVVGLGLFLLCLIVVLYMCSSLEGNTNKQINQRKLNDEVEIKHGKRDVAWYPAYISDITRKNGTTTQYVAQSHYLSNVYEIVTNAQTEANVREPTQLKVGMIVGVNDAGVGQTHSKKPKSHGWINYVGIITDFTLSTITKGLKRGDNQRGTVSVIFDSAAKRGDSFKGLTEDKIDLKFIRFPIEQTLKLTDLKYDDLLALSKMKDDKGKIKYPNFKLGTIDKDGVYTPPK